MFSGSNDVVSRPIRKRFSYGLAAFGLLLAACGEGEGAGTAVDDVPEQATDLAMDGETETTNAPDNLALVDDSEFPETDPGPFTGDPDSPWCSEMRIAGAESNPLSMDIFGLTPAEMEAQFRETATVFAQMEALAPDDIRQDVDEAADVFETFVLLGAEAGWDLDAMLADPGFMAAFDLLGLESAVSQIERYTLEVCGIELAS